MLGFKDNCGLKKKESVIFSVSVEMIPLVRAQIYVKPTANFAEARLGQQGCDGCMLLP